MKNVRIWIFSGPYFPAFGLNTERYSVRPNGLMVMCGSKSGFNQWFYGKYGFLIQKFYRYERAERLAIGHLCGGVWVSKGIY